MGVRRGYCSKHDCHTNGLCTDCYADDVAKLKTIIAARDAVIERVREAILDNDLSSSSCRMAISILLQSPIVMTGDELKWAIKAIKHLTPAPATPEALRELTPEEAAAYPGLTDEQIREALEKGREESGFGDPASAIEGGEG